MRIVIQDMCAAMAALLEAPIVTRARHFFTAVGAAEQRAVQQQKRRFNSRVLLGVTRLRWVLLKTRAGG